MKRSGYMCLLLIILLAASFISGCARTVNMKSSSTPLSSPAALPTGGDGKLTVVFMGNSKIYVSEIPTFFKKFVKGQSVSVTDLSVGAASFSTHIERMKQDINAPIFKKADVIVLQEYAGGIPNGYEELDTIMSIFGKNKKYYYYSAYTVADDATIAATKAFFDKRNIELIPCWFLNEYSGPLKEENFHMPGDPHLGLLYGYGVAGIFYCMMYHKKCTDLPYDSDSLLMQIPGNKTDAEKAEIIKGIQEACQKTMDKYEGK